MKLMLRGCKRFDLWDLAKGRSEWPLLGVGVRIKVLQEGPEPGESTALLSYVPGASVGIHRHIGEETIFILEGSQTDETGTYGPGTWLCNPAGTEHSVKSLFGCLILIHWKAPVFFLEESPVLNSI
jgi:anti-sigma factor ChrR (cupin superfamily)